MPKKEDCPVRDSSLCRWINKSCDNCYILKMKSEQAEQAKDNFEVTMSLLPPDFDELQGEECQFCIGEKGKRSVFANIDFANSEPKSETGMFFGLGKKVRRRVGSYLLTSISICQRCRRVMFLAGMFKWILSILAFVIAAVVLSTVSTGLGDLVSLCIILASVGLGYLLGTVISNAYIKSKKEKVRFDVFQIPVCDEMRDRGWFLMQENPKFIFSKKPGMGTIADIIKSNETDEVVQTSLFKD